MTESFEVRSLIVDGERACAITRYALKPPAGSPFTCNVALGPDLIVRVGPERYAKALAKPHARVFDFSGGPSKGIVYVGPKAIRTSSGAGTMGRTGPASEPRNLTAPRSHPFSMPRSGLAQPRSIAPIFYGGAIPAEAHSSGRFGCALEAGRRRNCRSAKA